MAVYEIAILVKDTPGGLEEGDIIECRKPVGGIGLKEAGICIWGKAVMSESLASAVTRELSNTVKRRYQIPLDKLKELDASFDLDRARNVQDQYQPYLSVDANYLFVDPDPQTFELETLQIVWDKQTETYI